MKKIQLLIVFISFLSGVLLADDGGFKPIVQNYELGYRGGYAGSSDDVINDAIRYGFEGGWLLGKNMRLTLSIDHFISKGYKENSTELIFLEWQNASTESISQGLGLYDKEFEIDLDLIPVMVEFDYIIQFEKSRVFFGIGAGYSFNDMDLTIRYLPIVVSGDQDMPSTLSRNTSQASDIDDSLVGSVSMGYHYDIDSEWSVGLVVSYSYQKIKGTMTEYVNGSDLLASYAFDMNVDYYSIFISFKNKFWF